MTSNYSTTEVEAEEIKNKNVNVAFYILRISTTLYHNYLLYIVKHTFKWQVITANRCENKKSRVKMSMAHSIHLGIILHYITLTFYYILKKHSDDK